MELIIHPDELFLKGANQRYFFTTLLKNLKLLFPNTQNRRVEGGIWMAGIEKSQLKKLEQIPGIANFAIAKTCKLDLEEIKKTIDQLIDNKSKKFRITAKRTNKKFALRSKEISIELGDYVRKKHNLKVDLKNFDLNIHVKILQDKALVFANTVEGVGGLPTGVSGKVLCLLSGGIDSPVAAFKTMVRGAEIGLVHFHNNTASSDEVGEKIHDIAKKLSRFQPKIKLFMVPFNEIQRQIVMYVPAEYRMIINRYVFFTLAQQIAEKNNYKALATGDSLGQVASQTIENLGAVYRSTNMLKISPLIGLNKREITDIATDIDTLSISQRPYEDCCSLFVAKHPVTKSKVEDVLRLAKEIDLSTLDKKEIKSYYISTN